MCSTEQQVAKTFEVRQTSRMPFRLWETVNRHLALRFSRQTKLTVTIMATPLLLTETISLSGSRLLLPINSEQGLKSL